jgi:uncharacterized protein (TIGR02147 family)
MGTIFDYQSYRDYLRDYYNEQKATKKSFSYRSFSQKAGLNTSSFLYHVIQGKKNLTKNTVVKLCAAIGLGRKESEYFEHLVFFNQAKTIGEKTLYYSRLIEIRRPIDIQNIEKDRYDYYSKWYNSVIREIVTFLDFGDDFSQLGRALVPPITGAEAKASVELLEKLKFIERGKNGLYRQTSELISTKPGPAELFAVQKFQIEMLGLAIKSYDQTSIHERKSTSTTISISGKSIDLVKMRIREFQREIMEIAKMDTEQNRAHQLTINFFPVSRSSDDDTK